MAAGKKGQVVKPAPETVQSPAKEKGGSLADLLRKMDEADKKKETSVK